MRKTPGGGHPIRLVTLENALKLVMVLPGKFAKETRAQFAKIIHRYMAGDESLHREIQNNAESSSPVAQLARATLEKRGRDEFDQEERLIAMEERRQKAKQMALENIKNTMEILTMTAIDPRMPIDDRTKLQMQDLAKNILFTNGAITNGESGNSPIDFQMVSKDLQLDCTLEDAKTLGRMMAERYRSVHQKNPPQHMQYVGGKTIPVNSYMEKDREMMVEVIKEYHDHPPKPKKQKKSAVLPGQATISFPVGSTVLVASPQ